MHGQYLCPTLAVVEAGEWGSCAGVCQAQMGLLLVVKVIQPLLRTQAQPPDPVSSDSQRCRCVSPGIPIHPLTRRHAPWPQCPLCSAGI